MRKDALAAVLWDLDGTLVDSEPLHHRTLVELLVAEGCRIPPDIEATVIGMSIDEVHAILQGSLGLALPLDVFAARRTRLYLDLVRDLKPRAGAFDVVEAIAAAGLAQAIVSNSERQIVDANIVASGFDQFGMPSVSRDDVAMPKPHPEPYLRGATLLGIPIAACVVVEDSPTGARAGLASGARVIAWPAPDADLSFDAGSVRVATAADLLVALGLERRTTAGN